MEKKYNIFTQIEGVKQYVRRIRRSERGVAVTMLCVSNTKAKDFGSLEKVTEVKDKMGIGYAIEVNK